MNRIAISYLPLWLLLSGLFVGNPLPAAEDTNSALARDRVFFDENQPTAVDTVFTNENLAGIYQLALENDLTFAQAQAQLRADVTQRTSTRAGLLTNSNFQYSTSQSDTDSQGVFLAGGVEFPNNTTNITDTDRWSASLTQPVLDLGAWFDFRQGVVLSEQAEVTFALAQQDLLVRTIDAYLAVSRASANLEASRSQEQAFASQSEQINQQFDVGLVPITDVQEAQAAYDQASAQVISDEGALETAREQLTVLTGRSHDAPLWELRSSFPITLPEPADNDQWVQFAEANNLDIQFAEYSVQAARLGLRSATTAFAPTINFSYSFTHTESDRDQTTLAGERAGERSVTPNDSQSGNRNFTFALPLTSGGATWAARRRASANVDVQDYGYQGTVRQITQQTRAAFVQARTNMNLVRANERAMISTETALEATRAGFEVGTRNTVDVVNAQQAYSDSLRNYYNSKLDYVLSVIELKRLAGTLSPGDIYDINAWLDPPEQEGQ